jgi:hypothetical protein
MCMAQNPLRVRGMQAIQFEEWLKPETILPEQFHRMWCGSRRHTPERMLLIAMLWQAADDLRQYRDSRRAHSRRLYREAYRWVVSDDRSWPYSFLNVCDVLGISAAALRAQLMEPAERAAA